MKKRFITIEPLDIPSPRVVGNTLFLPRNRFNYLFPEIEDPYRYKPVIVLIGKYHAFVSVPVVRKNIVYYRIKKVNKDLLFLSSEEYIRKLVSIVVAK